jgi:hypothetical protein
MGDLNRSNCVGDACSNIMIVRTVLIERVDSFGNKIDIDASPPLLVEKQSIRTENRMVRTHADVDTLDQSESSTN